MFYFIIGIKIELAVDGYTIVNSSHQLIIVYTAIFVVYY